MTVVLPCIVASGSKSTHSSPHHWSVSNSHVQSGVPGCIAPGSNIEVFITSILIPVVDATLLVICVSVTRVGLDPPVAVGVSLECKVDLLVAPLVHVVVEVASVLAMIVEVGVAPVSAASVAQRPPVDSDVSVLSGSEFTISSVHNIEVRVGTVQSDEVGTESSPAGAFMSCLVTATAPDHDWIPFGALGLRSRSWACSHSVRLSSNVVSLVVVVQPAYSMSVVAALTVRVDVPAVVDIRVERNIDELISPAVHLLSVLVSDLSLNIDSRVTPSPVWSVTHVVPVDSEGTGSDGSPETVVVVLSGEVLVVVCPELDSGRAVVLPSLSSMSSLATLTSEKDWWEQHNWVATSATKSVRANLVDLVVVVYPIRGVTVVSLLRP
jgi:hypothetical protein